MKLIVRCLVFVLAVLAGAGSVAASYPLVRNYPQTMHQGGPQVWAITRDGLGRMLIGCRSGLMSFDGSDWDIIGVANSSTVRSILEVGTGPDRRIYVGASEELGYFTSDSISGRSRYHSLTHLLPVSALPFNEIWNIFSDSEGHIWFQADFSIFHYDGEAMTVIPVEHKIVSSAKIGSEVYIATSPGGPAVIRGNSVMRLPGAELTGNAKICAILPFYDKVMLVSDFKGLFAYDGTEIRPLQTPFDDFLRNNQVFCASTQDNTFAFGTVSQGVVVANFVTGRITYANKDTGMQNNTVLCSYFDCDGNLWLGLDDGLDLVYVNSPIYSLLGNNSDYGAGYSSCRMGNTHYLGTNQGLFAMPDDTPGPTPARMRPILNGQIWDIHQNGNEIFVCSDAGASYGREGHLREVEGLLGCWYAQTLPDDENTMLVSAYDNFHLLRRENGLWVDKGVVDGFADRGGRFMFDNDGHIWLAHWLKGIYCLTLDPDRLRFSESRFYDSTNGFPSNRYINISLLDGRPVFTAERGFYRLTRDKGGVISDSTVSAILGSPETPRLYPSPTGNLWCITSDRISVVIPRTAGEALVDTTTYSPMTDRFIPGFTHFEFISDSRLVTGMQNGFFDVDLRAPSAAPSTSGVYFKQLVSYGDSAVMRSPVTSAVNDIVLPYSLNSQHFVVAAPENRAVGAVKFSYFLENYDSDWSEPTASTSKEYTKLPEGRYIMHVRAHNAYTRTTDENVLHFSILAPWYRSRPAMTVYAILGLLLLTVGYWTVKRLSLRASKRMAERKQQEIDTMERKAREDSLIKDYEIADLKGRQLEQDIQFKTRELSNITMNVVRKNEILQDISNRLDKLSALEDKAEINRHITHIRSLIRENISHDDDWRTFMHNFDAAYGDFTQRLQQRHAGLTPTELRVCCYLIMGLNSKDMARVFNISHRSVEMTRYRLRKKLELTRDTNLSDYLQSIFNSTD